jgi:hypothetical protein
MNIASTGRKSFINVKRGYTIHLGKTIVMFIQEFEQGYYALFLDGNFEASLILLDDLWDSTLNQYITSGPE